MPAIVGLVTSRSKGTSVSRLPRSVPDLDRDRPAESHCGQLGHRPRWLPIDHAGINKRVVTWITLGRVGHTANVIRGMGSYLDGHLINGEQRSGLTGEMGDARVCGCAHGTVRAGAQGARPIRGVGLFEPSLAELSLIQIGVRPRPVAGRRRSQPPPATQGGTQRPLCVRDPKLLSYYEKTSDVETGQIAIFLAEHFVITVRYGPLVTSPASAAGWNPTRFPGVRSNRRGPRDHGCDRRWVLGRRRGSRTRHRGAEESVFSAERTSDAEMIYRIKRENLWRCGVQSVPGRLLPRARPGFRAGIPEELHPYFRDPATIRCAWLSTPKATINC